MFHTQSLRQQRIAWWTVGLVIAVALATLSIAFVAFDGLSLGLPSTRQGVTAPVESGYEGSVTGPYGLDHMEGAPPAIGNQGSQGVTAPVESGYEGSVTGPYGLDHMEGTRQGVTAPVESGYEGSVTGPYGLDP